MYFILCPYQIHHWLIFWIFCELSVCKIISLTNVLLGFLQFWVGSSKTALRSADVIFFFHAVVSFLLSSPAFQTVLFKGIIVALPASFSESLFHNSLSAAAFWSRRAAFCFKIVDNMRWVSRIHVSFRRKPLEKELTSLALTDYLLHLCLDLGSRLCCVWQQWSIFLCLEFSNWVGGFFGDHFKEVLSLEVAWG